MKNKQLILYLLLCLTAFNLNSQNHNFLEKDSIKKMNRWIVRLGFNSIDDNGNNSGNPFNNFLNLNEEAYHGIPIKADIEYRFNKLFAAEVAGSINQWKAGKSIIESELVTKNRNYFAFDAGLKFYYDGFLNIFRTSDWLELYLNGGFGYFIQHKGAISGNLGTGTNIWISDHFGINFNATAKWVLNDSNTNDIYDTNHTQYTVGVSYRIKNNDNDNDHIYDYHDNCPNIFGERKFYGCPEKLEKNINNKTLDSDGDGVLDNLDNCPKVTGSKSNNGCPFLDSDKDGTIDLEDKCPNSYGLISLNGCPPLDSNKDEITNTIDKCTYIKRTASNNGCSKLAKTQRFSYNHNEINRLSRAIHFNTNKATFTKETHLILQNVISFVNRYPNSTFRIEGHTDNVGSSIFNSKLSKKRAKAVRTYLINHGVPEKRLEKALGFGERHPTETNLNKKGRAINRRVEINRTNVRQYI
jgi:outer membrane protein OmpA-like peptidoglycan-associated protein